MRIITRSIALLALFTFILGIGYPLLMTAVGRIVLASRSKGSLIERQGTVIGSSLIGQNFSSAAYFHPRPSMAGDAGYDAASSSASNLGPTSQKLIDELGQRAKRYREINRLDQNVPIPADAVMASGSGLDPHISVENAKLQAKRVASVRGLSEAEVLDLIGQFTEKRTLWIFDKERVHVLKLNLALSQEK